MSLDSRITVKAHNQTNAALSGYTKSTKLSVYKSIVLFAVDEHQ